jgi:hypothetical protein
MRLSRELKAYAREAGVDSEKIALTFETFGYYNIGAELCPGLGRCVAQMGRPGSGFCYRLAPWRARESVLRAQALKAF